MWFLKTQTAHGPGNFELDIPRSALNNETVNAEINRRKELGELAKSLIISTRWVAEWFDDIILVR